MQPDSIGLLQHISQAAEFIAEDTHGASLDAFLASRHMRQLVERNLTIIGEAASRIDRHGPETAQRISEISRIIGMRNILIHAYMSINYRTVWQTVQESIPVLRLEVDALLREGEEGKG